MALDPSNSSNLEQLALKGLNASQHALLHSSWLISLVMCLSASMPLARLAWICTLYKFQLCSFTILLAFCVLDLQFVFDFLFSPSVVYIYNNNDSHLKKPGRLWPSSPANRPTHNLFKLVLHTQIHRISVMWYR